MRELITEAVVLGIRPHKENDRLIDFLTNASGRIEALAVSGRKTASKLSPHCVFGSFVLARLVLKNRITIADSLTKEAPLLAFPLTQQSPKGKRKVI